MSGDGARSSAGTELTSEQYARAKRHFLELCEASAEARAAALAGLAASDARVAREVEGMLAVDSQRTVFGHDDSGKSSGGAGATEPGMPARIGRYRVVRLLGEGGMGRVFEAEQESPRRLVALKVVKFGIVGPSVRRRFSQEAEILARLQHVGIAQIYEAGQAELAGQSLPYFAMELIDGPSLTRHAHDRGLSIRERLELIARVCDAVDHAHQKGVIHRDLKPGNILVDGSGQPKVLDFGVARAAEIAGNAAVTMTVQGQIVGTLAYMAPEQATGGEERIGPETDVYALGAIAFELLTGRPPHDLAGLSLATALRVLMQEPAPGAGSVVPALKGDVETIIGKALEMEPARRYASAAAMGADIRRYLENRPIAARPAGRGYRARKFVARNRMLAAGASATVLTLCAGLAVSVVLGLGERRERDLAQERETLARKNAVVAAGALVNAALASRLSDRPWAGVKQLVGVPRELVGWEARYVARQLPWVLSGGAPGRSEFIGENEIVTCGPDGSGGLWNIDDPWSGRGLSPHAGSQASNSTFAAVIREPRLMEVVDVSTRATHSSIRMSGDIAAVSCSKDGRTVAAIIEGPVGVCYRDGTEILRLAGSLVLQCSAGGEFLARRGDDGSLSLIEARTGKVLHSSAGDGKLANGMGPAPDLYFFQPGQGSLSAVDARSIATLWTADDGISPGWAYSPDGTLIATPMTGSGVRLRDARTGAVQRSLSSGATGPMSFSLDNSTLVMHGKSGRCTAWDLRSGAVLADFDHGRAEQAAEPTVSGDGRRSVLRSPAWDLPWVVDFKHPWQDEPAYVELKGHTEWVYNLAISHDGTLVASAAPMDPMVRLWDAFSGEQLAALERGCDPKSYEAFLAFSSDDLSLVATSFPPASIAEPGRCGVMVWDLATGGASFEPVEGARKCDDDVLIPPMAAHLGTVRGATLSARAQMNPAGDVVARGGRSEFPDILRLLTMPGLAPASTPISEVFGISFHPSGKLLACGALGRIRVLDVASGRVVADVGANLQPREYLTRGERVYCVAYSPDGSRLAAGAADGSVTIYETEFYQPMVELPPHHGAEYSYVYALGWTPDGTRLISVSGDKTLRIWDSLSPFFRRRQAEAIATAAEPMRHYLDGRLDGRADELWTAMRSDATLDEASRVAGRRALIERWAAKGAHPSGPVNALPRR